MTSTRSTLLLSLLLSGCGPTPNWSGPESTPASPKPERARTYDADEAGAIHGKILWPAPIPSAPPFTADHSAPGYERRVEIIANPLLPKIDPTTKSLAGAFIRLEGIDLSRARPWNPTPLQVSIDDTRIHLQDTPTTLAGVRRGDSISIINTSQRYQMLRAEGAAWFTLPLPRLNIPSERRLVNAGWVELSNPAAFWQRAWLFVSDDPYFAITDNDGHFRIDGIPPGSYRLSITLPDWQIDHQDRNPDSGLPCRVYYKPLRVKEMEIDIPAGTAVERVLEFGE